jgi:cell wall-associated NlpC family hydrolase
MIRIKYKKLLVGLFLLILLLASKIGYAVKVNEQQAVQSRLSFNLWQNLFGKIVVERVQTYLGVPYTWGGKSPQTGFDCSGLTWYIFSGFGVEIPHGALAQYQKGIIVERPALKAGDLVFFVSDSFRTVMHVGIYEGNDIFIHAPDEKSKVRRDSLRNAYYQKRYIGARRYLPVSASH